MNKSIKEIARIAKKYMYKAEIVRVNPQKAFLSISDNFLKSPFPRHLTSNVCNVEYVEKVFNEM